MISINAHISTVEREQISDVNQQESLIGKLESC